MITVEASMKYPHKELGRIFSKILVQVYMYYSTCNLWMDNCSMQKMVVLILHLQYFLRSAWIHATRIFFIGNSTDIFSFHRFLALFWQFVIVMRKIRQSIPELSFNLWKSPVLQWITIFAVTIIISVSHVFIKILNCCFT